MDARELHRERFLLLIDQVMEERNCSERDASKWVGLDFTFAYKVRTEDGSTGGRRRSVGAESWDKIQAKIGLRSEWFTNPNLGPKPRWREYAGPVRVETPDTSALSRYIERRKKAGMVVAPAVERQAFAIAARTGVTDASAEALVNFASSLVVDGVIPGAGPNEATRLADGQVKRSRRRASGE